MKTIVLKKPTKIQHVKPNLPFWTVRDYVVKFKSVIMTRVARTILLPSIVMAQAILSSVDDKKYIGNSILAKVHNNQLRLLADPAWKGRRVLLPDRQRNGSTSKEKIWYRKYPSPESSIGDFIDLLTTKVQFWPRMFWYEDTVRLQAAILQVVMGIPDENNGERIVKLIEKHNLHWMDRQWMVQKVWTLTLRIIILSALSYLFVHWDDIVPWR